MERERRRGGAGGGGGCECWVEQSDVRVARGPVWCVVCLGKCLRLPWYEGDDRSCTAGACR